MLGDSWGSSKAPVDEAAVDGPELPQSGEQLEGEEGRSGSEGGEGQPDGSLLDPPLRPRSEFDPAPVGRGRRRLVGLAPAAMLIPLALVSLGIYLLNPGWLQGAEPTVSPQPTEVARATLQPALPTAGAKVATLPPATAMAMEFDDLLAEAQALVWQSKFEQAIAIYEDLALRSADARPEIGWARALLLDGLPDQALGHAQVALTLAPENVEATIALAQAYMGVGDKARGLSAAQSALGLDSRNADAHAVLAEAYLLNGQPGKAIAEANLALAQDGKSAEAHRIRGMLYETVDDDLEAALREFRLAADLQPELWMRHYDLGLALLKAEDYDAAIVALTEAWALRRSLLTYGALGQAYYLMGQYDQAASYLEQSLSAGAWNADTYALLASVDAQRGRCSDATTYAKQALAQDPNSPLALGAMDACRQDVAVGAPTPTESPSAQGTPEPSPAPVVLRGQIAFPAWNGETGEYDTYVANVSSGERKLVIEGMHQPAFSPDGQWLAVNGELPEHLNLCIVRPDGSGLQEITEHVEDGLPCWSPAPLPDNANELSLAFSSTRHGDRQSRIYILDRVPFDGQEAQDRTLDSGADDVRGVYPAWVMDGGPASVVYSGCRYDGMSAECGLMLMPAEPGPQAPQTLTSHAGDTAPAGHDSRIAFMSDRDGNWEIYLVNRDGSGLKRLTHNAANDGLPTWSPDGKTIAFVSDEGGTWAIWTVSPDGSDRRKLFELGGSGLASDWQQERISWGPDSDLSP